MIMLSTLQACRRLAQNAGLIAGPSTASKHSYAQGEPLVIIYIYIYIMFESGLYQGEPLV